MRFALTVGAAVLLALGQFSGLAGYWSEAHNFTMAAIAAAALAAAWRD